jgi:hypothetical protein
MGIVMKKLLAALIAGLFAAGAFAQAPAAVQAAPAPDTAAPAATSAAPKHVKSSHHKGKKVSTAQKSM